MTTKQATKRTGKKKEAVVETPSPTTVPLEKLSKTDQKEVQVVVQQITTPAQGELKLSRQQIDLIKKTIAQGASDDELMLFLNICKGAQLNPFLHHAHFVPFWDSKSGTEKRAVVIGIDGFRSIAESTGKYAGSDDAVFEGGEDLEVETKTGKVKFNAPKKATVAVYKVVEGQRYPFTASARWSEYYPGPKKGMRWNSMPYLMLSKCAEALALRKAFPKVLSGMYAPEEMEQAQQGAKEEKRANDGFTKLMKFAEKATAAELEEWKAKIEGSDKYTAEQKSEFKKVADKRISEIS